MFAYKVKAEEDTPHDTDKDFTDATHEIWCWRKHPLLHRWMVSLYYKKGGQSSKSNTFTVRLVTQDLKDLTNIIREDDNGCFFGECEYSPSQHRDDTKFINAAFNSIYSGYNVYFTSSW
jgi:hypothetical protein